jgi:hypothetical protein
MIMVCYLTVLLRVEVWRELEFAYARGRLLVLIIREVSNPVRLLLRQCHPFILVLWLHHRLGLSLHEPQWVVIQAETVGAVRLLWIGATSPCTKKYSIMSIFINIDLKEEYSKFISYLYYESDIHTCQQ